MPSSVEASEEIVVGADPSECFSFFTDLANIGTCIPGCEQVTPLNAQSAIFKVKVKVGYISKTFELKAKLTELMPNNHLSFTGEGSDAEITGIVDLNPKEQNPTITKVKYTITIKPVSVIGKTAISMIGNDLVKKQASEFAACVKKKLEV